MRSCIWGMQATIQGMFSFIVYKLPLSQSCAASSLMWAFRSASVLDWQWSAPQRLFGSGSMRNVMKAFSPLTVKIWRHMRPMRKGTRKRAGLDPARRQPRMRKAAAAAPKGARMRPVTTHWQAAVGRSVSNTCPKTHRLASHWATLPFECHRAA